MPFPTRALLLLCTFVVFTPSAYADLQTYQFSGLINTSEAAGIPVGSAISVTFLYDNAASTTGGGINYKDFRTTLGGIHAEVAGAAFQTGATLDMGTAHEVGFIGWPGVPSGNYDDMDFSGVDVTRHLVVFMNLLDADQSVFASSRDLPTTLPLPAFETVFFEAYEPGSKRITGLLTSIPEPSGGLLLLTVVALCAGAIRRGR
jgi:hypothetical protein